MKTDSKGYVLQDSDYLTFQKDSNYSDRKKWLSGAGARGRIDYKRLSHKGKEGILGGDETVLC